MSFVTVSYWNVEGNTLMETALVVSPHLPCNSSQAQHPVPSIYDLIHFIEVLPFARHCSAGDMATKKNNKKSCPH